MRRKWKPKGRGTEASGPPGARPRPRYDDGAGALAAFFSEPLPDDEPDDDEPDDDEEEESVDPEPPPSPPDFVSVDLASDEPDDPAALLRFDPLRLSFL